MNKDIPSKRAAMDRIVNAAIHPWLRQCPLAVNGLTRVRERSNVLTTKHYFCQSTPNLAGKPSRLSRTEKPTTGLGRGVDMGDPRARKAPRERIEHCLVGDFATQRNLAERILLLGEAPRCAAPHAKLVEGRWRSRRPALR